MEFFHNLLCNADSQSAGRQMAPFMSDPSRKVLSQNIPVGNNALQAVGVASIVRGQPGRPIVVCSLGDGASQQGEVLEAIAEAVRSELPVLFVFEDNGYSISTTTKGKTFFSLPPRYDRPEQFYGLPIHRLNGRDVVTILPQLAAVVGSVRTTRSPALIILEVDRLGNHTNADDEQVYRTRDELDAARRSGDPLRNLREHLLESGVPAEQLDRIAAEVAIEVKEAAETARRGADPRAVFDAKASLPKALRPSGDEYRGSRDEPQLTMLEAIRAVLANRMAADLSIILLGQDIEDPKGDVFGVTRGLTRAYPGRVQNAALSESTILGVSIGRALAGVRPVAFIQFADFLPLAFNQICSELGSMYWRTNGGWSCPVIVMVACGGYRPGLGPFHAQTLESVLAHVPGVDVLMPSSAADAAGLLNAAFGSNRPTIFFYPKIVLNDRDRTTSPDVERQRVPIGKAHRIRRGDDLTIVAWGSTVPLGEEAAAALESVGLHTDLIDLRSISPWDKDTVCESAQRTGKLIVVHEDNQTCGFGAEVVAAVVETVGPAVVCRRVARPDTYIACNFANQLEVLPSFRRLLTVAAELLDLSLVWERLPQTHGGHLVLEAPRSSPADQSVTVTAWEVQPGDRVRAGQRIAELEADKAVFELGAPADGRIEAILVPIGQTVRVGTPLLRLEAATSGTRHRWPTREDPGTPHLTRRGTAVPRPAGPRPGGSNRSRLVGLSAVAVALGSDQVSNEDLVRGFPGRTAAEIFRRTGIESRRRLGVHESALSLAVEAARQALHREQRSIHEIDALICCTATPLGITPSMACQILYELCKDGAAREISAHDINAACCGYLYALATAFDWTRTFPESRILIITTETMSRLTDPTDFETAVLFGDAASATIVSGPEAVSSPAFLLRRPLLSTRGECGKVLRVPAAGTGHFAMDGKRAYFVAIQQMPAMLTRACVDAGLRLEDLRWIVPHQANGRLIKAVGVRLGLPPERVFGNVRSHGNTSSSSIPLCLAELACSCRPGDKIGLTAFGGGLTFAAAILEFSPRVAGTLGSRDPGVGDDDPRRAGQPADAQG